MGSWVFDPRKGGTKIPEKLKPLVRQRILDHANKNYGGKFSRLEIIFKGHFCYIDAYSEESSDWPTHLCRIRYLGSPDRWTMAFYTYSSERYEPCFFRNGSWLGTPEEAFDIGATYLR